MAVNIHDLSSNSHKSLANIIFWNPSCKKHVGNVDKLGYGVAELLEDSSLPEGFQKVDEFV